jgi:hypothetical protein
MAKVTKLEVYTGEHTYETLGDCMFVKVDCDNGEYCELELSLDGKECLDLWLSVDFDVDTLDEYKDEIFSAIQEYKTTKGFECMVGGTISYTKLINKYEGV